jgi:hypothetical protein
MTEVRLMKPSTKEALKEYAKKLRQISWQLDDLVEEAEEVEAAIQKSMEKRD